MSATAQVLDSIDGNNGIEAQAQYPILSQKSKRHSIGLKFMGLSFHPLSGKPNAELMPNRLDEQAYFVWDLGALLTYEYFIVPDILSVKFVDTKYYKGTPTDKWQYKFLWYGGELEYKFAISSKLDFATIFVPGYPDLMAFAVGLNYKL